MTVTDKHRFLIYNNTYNKNIQIDLYDKLKSEFTNAGYLNTEISIDLASNINSKNDHINTSAIVIAEIKEFNESMAFINLNEYFKIPYRIDVLINELTCLVDIQYLFNVPYYEYKSIHIPNLIQTLININS